MGYATTSRQSCHRLVRTLGPLVRHAQHPLANSLLENRISSHRTPTPAPVAIFHEGLLQLAINKGVFADAYGIRLRSDVVVTIGEE